MKARTTKSGQDWQSPDGKRTIWSVVLESDGKQYPLKTYSEKIAKVGFEGDVESYTNDRGDRFVKQVAKPQAGYGAGGSNYQPRDEAAIKSQWAVGQAIGLVAAIVPKEKITMTLIESYAKDIYATMERVKGSQP